MNEVIANLRTKQANYRRSAVTLETRELQLMKELQEVREAKASALQCSQLIDETLADIAAAGKPAGTGVAQPVQGAGNPPA